MLYLLTLFFENRLFVNSLFSKFFYSLPFFENFVLLTLFSKIVYSLTLFFRNFLFINFFRKFCIC